MVGQSAMVALSAALLAAFMPQVSVAGRLAGSRVEDDLPVTKVIKLLQAMQKDLEQDFKEDEDTFKRLQCWCNTNEEKKTQAVEDAKTTIDQLESKVEAASGRTGELSTEIEQTKQDIVETEKALAEAAAMRKKEAAAFHAQELEMVSAVKLLHGAITALEKHHPDKTGLIQSAETELTAMKPSLRRLVHRNAKLFGWLRNSNKKDALLKFIDANADILDPDDLPAPAFIQQLQQRQLRASTVPFFKSYAPQSGQIFGILRQMKEDFEADLPEIQREESGKVTVFAEMKGMKESQLKQMKTQIKEKTAELANTKEELATARGDLEDTRAAMSADQKTLLMITERCQEGNFEWERRSKLRAQEIEAVSQAISILTADKVKDGQQTNWGAGGQAPEAQAPPALLQIGASNDQWRGRVAQILHRASSTVTLGAKDLALLAVLAQTGPFEKVNKAIDGLIAKLNDEMGDEVKQHDFCVDALHENEVITARTNHTIERLDAELEALKANAKEIETTIHTLRDAIATMQVELQRASQNRQAENVEFQKVVKDQKVLVAALNAAHEKLAGFYMAHETFLQKQDPAAPKGSAWNHGNQDVSDAPEFQDYDSHGNSNHVLTLLQKLQGEAKVLLDDSHHDEQGAQVAYEALVQDTNDAIKANTRTIADKTEELATVKEAIDRTAADKARAVKELEALGEENAALHGQCDFLLKNFGARQDSRATEIEALREVKAILSGMKSE